MGEALRWHLLQHRVPAMSLCGLTFQRLITLAPDVPSCLLLGLILITAPRLCE